MTRGDGVKENGDQEWQGEEGVQKSGFKRWQTFWMAPIAWQQIFWTNSNENPKSYILDIPLDEFNKMQDLYCYIGLPYDLVSLVISKIFAGLHLFGKANEIRIFAGRYFV